MSMTSIMINNTCASPPARPPAVFVFKKEKGSKNLIIRIYKKMYINYKKLENPQFIFKLNDGTYTEMIPVNDVKKINKKLKAAKALGKKYKIKGKHLRD